MEILKLLIPRVHNNFKLKLLTKEDIYKLIDKLKPSKSKGHDELNNDIIKKLKYEITPYLLHLYNNIITKAIYPHIFKLQRITPLCKPDKDPLNIASYRPINNLIALAKLFDAHILECITLF